MVTVQTPVEVVHHVPGEEVWACRRMDGTGHIGEEVWWSYHIWWWEGSQEGNPDSILRTLKVRVMEGVMERERRKTAQSRPKKRDYNFDS